MCHGLALCAGFGIGAAAVPRAHLIRAVSVALRVLFVFALNTLHLEMGPLMLGLVLGGGMTCAVISEVVIEAPIRRARQAPAAGASDRMLGRYRLRHAA
jgi:hypothetical protein